MLLIPEQLKNLRHYHSPMKIHLSENDPKLSKMPVDSVGKTIALHEKGLEAASLNKRAREPPPHQKSTTNLTKFSLITPRRGFT